MRPLQGNLRDRILPGCSSGLVLPIPPDGVQCKVLVAATDGNAEGATQESPPEVDDEAIGLIFYESRGDERFMASPDESEYQKNSRGRTSGVVTNKSTKLHARND